MIDGDEFCERLGESAGRAHLDTVLADWERCVHLRFIVLEKDSTNSESCVSSRIGQAARHSTPVSGGTGIYSTSTRRGRGS